jgi:hypothetical protein
MIRPQPHYRRHAFESGLRAHGFTLEKRIANPAPGDCLVIWNRYGNYNREATRFESAGADVLVVENGYLGDGYYAIARNHHCGAGDWHVGGDRDIKGVSLKPWRKGGEEIVILAQRGIGEPGVTQPHRWLNLALSKLKRIHRRPVRVRAHPGTNKDAVPLEEDLASAYAVVTWASSAALKAICDGIPAYHALMSWIGAPAAQIKWNEKPYKGCRRAFLRRIAWAQWEASEIEQGTPFKYLCKS